jgi:CDK-activating kinase assembly factor MAT1
LLEGSGLCPECQTSLRRINFRIQLYEDAMVEKEVEIRKRILRDFNKKEEDFQTLREYDNYLEEIENIIYNLANNIDVIETNKKIEQYKKENKEQILKNKSKIGKKENELEELLELERIEQEEKRLELVKQELDLKKKKIREKEALIDELMFSECDARNIVQSFVSTIQTYKDEIKLIPKATGFSTGIKFGQQNISNFLPVPKIDEGPIYHYMPITQEIEGPIPPLLRELQTQGYITHVRIESEGEKAGGFGSGIACLRALQEAMAGLYHNSLKPSLQISI